MASSVASRDVLKRSDSRRLSQRQKPLRSHPVAVAIQKNEKYRVEDGHLDIQLDLGGQALDEFSQGHGLGVKVNFFDFGVGTHHEVLAPERDRERSIGLQWAALNV